VINELEFGHTHSVDALAFHPQGKLLFSGADGLKIWNIQTGRTIASWNKGNPLIEAIQLIPVQNPASLRKTCSLAILTEVSKSLLPIIARGLLQIPGFRGRGQKQKLSLIILDITF